MLESISILFEPIHKYMPWCQNTSKMSRKQFQQIYMSPCFLRGKMNIFLGSKCAVTFRKPPYMFGFLQMDSTYVLWTLLKKNQKNPKYGLMVLWGVIAIESKHWNYHPIGWVFRNLNSDNLDEVDLEIMLNETIFHSIYNSNKCAVKI